MPNDAVSPTAMAIQLYLQGHPNASDSGGGVQRWWLAEFGVVVPYETVISALHELVKLGVVQEHRLPDGTVVYSRAATKHDHP